MLTQQYDKNAFLGRLSSPEAALMRPHLRPFELRVGDVLHHHGDVVEDVFFPHSGLITKSMPLLQGPSTGGVLIGRDGIVGGLAAAATAPATCDAEVHIAGQASRMSAPAFRHVLDQSPGIRRLAARFYAAMMAHAQQIALCNATHPVESRICRWLLEVQDRNGSSRVPLTQSAMAQVLGVRRTTVTLIAGRLEAAGVVNGRRGCVHIVNRDELERRSCECYGHLQRYMAKLFASSALDTAVGGATAYSASEAQTVS